MWAEFLAGHVWSLVLLVVLLCLSAFLSGSETALFSLSPGQLLRLRRGRGRAGRMVTALMERPREVLHCLLLGNLIVNVAYSSGAAMIIIDLSRAGPSMPAWTAPVASLVPVLGLILAGEVVPKMLALLAPQRWALAAAAPLSAIKRVSYPFVAVLNRALVGPLTQILAPRHEGGSDISAEELAALLDLSAKRGILDLRTSVLLQEIVELTDLRVSDVMVPRVDMICYDVDAPRAGLVKLFRRTHLRRVPVYAGDVDHTLGVIHAKRVLFNPHVRLRDIVVKVPILPEAANLERALVQLRSRGAQMGIVVDEYGGTAGLVTVEDILEEIVGDLAEPHEAGEGPPVRQMGPGHYILAGDLAIHEWADAIGMDLGGGRISTVGGFVTSLLGRLPVVGDEARYRNLTFRVLEVRRRRITRLEVRLREVQA